ncbi:MAG: hypothetical protein R2792_19125 [Saprospiraceae bacterium]
MLPGFENLSSAEVDQLVAAPVLITVLIGAADGELDREERKWSERLTKVKTYSNPNFLTEYYQVVSNGFLDKVDQAMANLPSGVEERSEEIKTKLEGLNPILAKLDTQLAYELYKGFLGLAKETANASGGFLRIGAVSAAEYAWVELPMITPIEFEEEEATDED